MAKVVLIETHPLMRLGLTQLISGMGGSWDVVSLDSRTMDEFAYLACDVDLVVLGMPLDVEAGWRSLSDVERLLRPRRVLLLSEPSVNWEPPPGGLPACVYGCISSTASIDVVEAAIRLSIASTPGTEPVSPARSTLLASPTGASAGMAGTPVTTVATAAGHDAIAEPGRAGPPGLLPLGARPPAGAAAPPASASPAASAPAPAQASTMDAATGAQLLNVTPRQYEVLTLLARGYPIKTVSRILNISTATAKAHASTLYQRLRVSSKGEAVYAARQRGIHFD